MRVKNESSAHYASLIHAILQQSNRDVVGIPAGSAYSPHASVRHNVFTNI
jgi:hypothetical protein